MFIESKIPFDVGELFTYILKTRKNHIIKTKTLVNQTKKII